MTIMHTPPRWGAIVLALIMGLASASPQPREGVGAVDETKFKQDRFAIGFWVDPPLDDKADARYKEIADANFTLVIGGFGGNSAEKARQQLGLCEKYGLKAIVTSHGCEPPALPDSPACWGYTLRDEPNAADFAALKDSADTIRAARPGKMVYVNLFPNYANAKQLGNDTYDEHVAQFCEIYKPSVLSMDHYPIFKPGHDGRDNYCANLEVMRTYALKHDIPFWNFFNTMPYGPHTDPTEAQLCWQIYTTLAYGGKGVLYFCYYTPLSHEFPKGGAIIGRDDRRTRHWYQARRINEQIRNLGPTLMQLTSRGVYRVKPGDDPGVVLDRTPIANISRADHDPDFDYLVGEFQHTDGRRAVLLNNYHFAYTQWPTVTFAADLAQVTEVDKWSGKEVPVCDDSPDMEGVQVSLDAGEGRLFLMP